MKPEDAAAIAEQVERARQLAEGARKDSTLQQIGDTATRLDSLGQIVNLAGQAGGFLWDTSCAAGKGVGAVCDAVSSVIPD
jgi:hypothetical protein